MFLLIVAGGVCFYIGWIQIDLPPGSYTVVHTRTGGYESELVRSGQFAWRWERLIPDNLTLYSFVTDPVSIDLPSISGILPSGEVFAAAMEGTPDFSFEVALTITISVQPDSLPQLVAEEGLVPADMGDWLERRAMEASSLATAAILADPAAYLEQGGTERLARQIQDTAAMQNLVVEGVIPRTIRVPDPALYAAARDSYLAMARAQQDQEIDVIRQQASNLRVLEEYGKLLNQYPVLLQYLYIRELKGAGTEGADIDILDILRALPSQ
jgi:hypothetical protein